MIVWSFHLFLGDVLLFQHGDSPISLLKEFCFRVLNTVVWIFGGR